MERKSLYHTEVYNDTLARIEKLTTGSTPQWGKMDAGQMMAHCSSVFEVFNGKPLVGTPFIVKLFKGMIRKMVVGEKPFPKNSRTHPQYLQTNAVDFNTEKQRLLNAMRQWKEMEDQETHHALFGIMSKEDNGWSSYKHLNHHLTQFGV